MLLSGTSDLLAGPSENKDFSALSFAAAPTRYWWQYKDFEGAGGNETTAVSWPDSTPHDYDRNTIVHGIRHDLFDRSSEVGSGSEEAISLFAAPDKRGDPNAQNDRVVSIASPDENGSGRIFVFEDPQAPIEVIGTMPVPEDTASTSRSDGPILANDDVIVLNGATESVDLLANDDVHDHVDRVDLVTLPSFGAVVIADDGTATYFLDEQSCAVVGLTSGEILIDTFEYFVTDADGHTATAEVTVEIPGPEWTYGFVLAFQDTFDSIGSAVAAAGDINGDGIDDFLIGSSIVGEHGVVYVIYGKDLSSGDSFDPTINLANLDGTDGFVIFGDPGDGRVGYSVNNLGDVNGDGIDDIILGASSHRSPNQGHTGSAYIVFGTEYGFGATFDLADLDGVNGFEVTGTNEDDRLGYKVETAGDLNNDGIVDLVVGGYGIDHDGNSQSGAAYVVFGKDTATDGAFDPVLAVEELDGTNGFALPGLATENHTGHSVGTAGDINGDGIEDLLVGAYGTDVDDTVDAGQVFVIFGKDTATEGDFLASIDLDALEGSDGFSVTGIDEGGSVGRNVGTAGDINGDGIDDILIGGFSYRSETDLDGTVYVIFGKDTETEGLFNATIDLATLDGTNGFTIESASPGEEDAMGRGFAAVGDINEDGIDDFMIGAPNADHDGLSRAGEVYLIFGNAEGFGATFDLNTLDGTNGYIFGGVSEEEHVGYSVDTTGDIDGDGINDIIIGVYGDERATDPITYETYVVYGGMANLASLDAEDGTVDGQIDLTLLATHDNDSSDGDAPVVDGALEDQSGEAGQPISFTLPENAFSDPDDDDLTLTAHLSDGQALPDWLVFDAGARAFSGIPPEDFEGALSIVVRASDGTQYATDTFVLEIEAAPNMIVALGGGESDITGGGGGDLLSAASGSNMIDGGAGNDVLGGGFDDDQLFGGAGNDILLGDNSDLIAGADTLIGGTGDDLLEGGAGADTFIFVPGDGADTIGTVGLNHEDPGASVISGADFVSGVDVVVLSGFGLVDGSEALALVDDVDGVATFSDQGTTITFAGLTTGDLGADDFQIL